MRATTGRPNGNAHRAQLQRIDASSFARQRVLALHLFAKAFARVLLAAGARRHAPSTAASALHEAAERRRNAQAPVCFARDHARRRRQQALRGVGGIETAHNAEPTAVDVGGKRFERAELLRRRGCGVSVRCRARTGGAARRTTNIDGT